MTIAMRASPYAYIYVRKAVSSRVYILRARFVGDWRIDSTATSDLGIFPSRGKSAIRDLERFPARADGVVVWEEARHAAGSGIALSFCPDER